MKKNATKVMVVEDEILIGLMITKNLRSFGYTVGEVVTTGEEAIVRAGNEKPDVVLMDVTLAGEMNGLEAAKIIKAEHNIAIVICSCYTDKEFYDRAKQVNPVAIITKMGPFSDITSAIEKAMGR